MAEEMKETNDQANVGEPTASAEGSKSTDSDIDSLRREIAAKEQEAKNNYDRFVRQVAELENVKRRSAREREEASRFANETLIKDLLPVIDNLERAVAHASGGGNGNSIVEGVEMVLKGLLGVLVKHGVNQVSAVGQPFDPTKHEAIAQIESGAHDPNSVVEELHKGYMLRDRLLRPAMVSVAKASERRDKKNAEDKVENDTSDD